MSGRNLWLNVAGHTARHMGRRDGKSIYTCTKCGKSGNSIGHPEYIGRLPCTGKPQ